MRVAGEKAIESYFVKGRILASTFRFCCSDGEHSIVANSRTFRFQEIFKCTGKCIKALR
ncbi:hypothetical protein CY35_10G018800 [Sphagnum magellanicum]|nr:hypothetical protein CY35_10G018800 [Sphagnum magellanicum]